MFQSDQEVKRFIVENLGRLLVLLKEHENYILSGMLTKLDFENVIRNNWSGNEQMELVSKVDYILRLAMEVDLIQMEGFESFVISPKLYTIGKIEFPNTSEILNMNKY